MDMNENKLIAEFIGVVFHDDENQYYDNNGLYIGEELRYHTSWDWLMPVVEKIRSIKCYDKGDVFNYQFIIHNNKVEYYADGYTKKPSKIFLGYGKEAIYKAVVEFIKEYNKYE